MIENERLKKVRKALGLTQMEMAEKIGLKQGSYSDVERGKATVSNYVKLSLEKNLRVSKRWLEAGEGEMLVPEQTGAYPASALGIGPIDLGLREHRAIRLYSADSFETDGPYERIIIPGYKDCEIALEHYGDAMETDLYSGDIMLLKEWKDTFIEFGQTYLIITKNNHRMTRMILPMPENGTLSLEAANKHYPPIIVTRAHIKKLFIVMGKIERSTI